MKAYVILDVLITDKEKFLEYQKVAPGTVSLYNGVFIVRGGQITKHEGEWDPSRIVIIEFPSRKRAEEWLNSAEYGEATLLRQASAQTNLLIVDGI